MRTPFYFILLFLLLTVACRQKKIETKATVMSADSLELFFTQANNFDLPLAQREVFIKKALSINSKKKNDSIYRVNLFKIANRYYNIDKFNDYKKTVFLILNKAAVVHDNYSLAKGNAYLGDYYLLKEQADSSFFYYYKAEKKYVELGDRYNVAKAKLSKAILQYKQSDYLGAEIAVSKALKLVSSKKYNDILFDSYNLLGLIYNELEDYDKAVDYHKKALSCIDDELMESFAQPKATSYNNIGLVYLNKKEFKTAKVYFEKGLKLKNVYKNKAPLYAILLNNLAYSKFKLEDMVGLPQLFFQSLKIRDSLQLTTGIIASKINISEYFFLEKNNSKALKFGKEALQLSKKINNSQSILNSLKQLSLVDPKNIAFYNEEYIVVSEKRQKADRAIGNKFSRIEFETEEIKEKNSTLTSNNRNLLYGLIAFSIVGFLLYAVKMQKTRNDILLYKQEQQKANEDIYNLMISQQSTIESGRVNEKKRVAQELHDAILGRMFGLRINLDGLNKYDDSVTVEKRNNCLIELKNIEQDIREISHDLNREKSQLINNFIAILNNLFEEHEKAFSYLLKYTIDAGIKWDLIANSTKINIYRIIQESLQNINKHAKATAITIKIKEIESSLVIEIIDNGVGFSVSKVRKGMGLENIKSRTEECNGVLAIESVLGEGTRITVKITLA